MQRHKRVSSQDFGLNEANKEQAGGEVMMTFNDLSFMEPDLPFACIYYKDEYMSKMSFVIIIRPNHTLSFHRHSNVSHAMFTRVQYTM